MPCHTLDRIVWPYIIPRRSWLMLMTTLVDQISWCFDIRSNGSSFQRRISSYTVHFLNCDWIGLSGLTSYWCEIWGYFTSVSASSVQVCSCGKTTCMLWLIKNSDGIFRTLPNKHNIAYMTVLISYQDRKSQRQTQPRRWVRASKLFSVLNNYSLISLNHVNWLIVWFIYLLTGSRNDFKEIQSIPVSEVKTGF